jgi:hypothetical protein
LPGDVIYDKVSTHPVALGGMRTAIYVDNYLKVGHNRQEVRASGRLHGRELESLDLPIHEVEDAVEHVDFIGLNFNGATHEVRLPWKRLWKLRLALLHLEKIQ